MKQERAHALDALRGYAIMTMILSATEAFRVLPAWMYHAQVPPPDHVFNPSIYGITWVDLIFPFFLFSMGAAIPLSLGRQYKAGASLRKLCRKSAIRWLKLAFFAIFIYHTFPFMLGYRQEWLRYAVPLAGFALMFVLYVPNPFRLPELWRRIVNGAAYVVAGAERLRHDHTDTLQCSRSGLDHLFVYDEKTLCSVCRYGIHRCFVSLFRDRWIVAAGCLQLHSGCMALPTCFLKVSAYHSSGYVCGKYVVPLAKRIRCNRRR